MNIPTFQKDALITGFKTKTNSLGVTVAKIEFSVESENPEVDFAPLLQAQRCYVMLSVSRGTARALAGE